MRSRDLLATVQYECITEGRPAEIKDICQDTREVSRDAMWIATADCVYSSEQQLEFYVKEALIRGVAAIVLDQREQQTDSGNASLKALCNTFRVALYLVNDTREAVSLVASSFYDMPQKSLSLIGITGTKGKTTTAFLIREICRQAGIPCGLIGTNGAYILEAHVATRNTTPGTIELYRLLHQMRERGIQLVIMEVSSQGLKQHRVDGLTFSHAVFTNLGNDHIGIGEHTDLQDYMQSKQRLFTMSRENWFNQDDPASRQMAEHASGKIYDYSLQNRTATLSAHKIQTLLQDGELVTTFVTEGICNETFELHIPGMYNVYNALAAIAVAVSLDISPTMIQEGIRSARVKGRMETVRVPGHATFLIDYAHNAMSLEQLLLTLRQYEPKRLICICGCGGNRAVSRRYEMGETAGRLADYTILTSDNPRDEDPERILDHMEQGMRRTDGEYCRITDRAEAVCYAYAQAQEGDIIVLAGKGHEDYQEIRGIRYPMTEHELIEKAIELYT